jgi:hypothetical protein
MTKARTRLLILAAAAIALVCVVAANGSASAATRTAARAQPAAATYTWFWLQNDSMGGCIQEFGTTEAVYMGSCGLNHSDFWRWTAAGMLLNEHSNLCITVGTGKPGVYMAKCTNNHVQLWKTARHSPCSMAGSCYTLTNVHTNQWLSEEHDKDLTQVSQNVVYLPGQDSPYWDIVVR